MAEVLTKHIQISEESIKNGKQGKNDSCPIAIELNKQFGSYHMALVFDASAEVIHFHAGGSVTRYVAKLPATAMCFIEAFDEEGRIAVMEEWKEFDLNFEQVDP